MKNILEQVKHIPTKEKNLFERQEIRFIKFWSLSTLLDPDPGQPTKDPHP
jgi:hypothetical protein